ncbi:MAG TPA: RNA methyltransferase, partial [Ktedonobacteraceae bacterium]|nr:RNA methyltransferase [Ktedonobacteraceae bacterium]
CRTAECAGVQAVVIPAQGAAQVNGDAIKASAGALHSIPVCREANLKVTLDYLKESGLQIVSVTEKADDYFPSLDLTGPTAFIMGSEEDGISYEYIKKSDRRVKIPMAGKIESLNVSVAAGIVLFEAVKQRLKL